MTSWSSEGGDQGFCDDSPKALVIKCVAMGNVLRWEGCVSKIVQNCVTSFMDDLLEETNNITCKIPQHAGNILKQRVPTL